MCHAPKSFIFIYLIFKTNTALVPKNNTKETENDSKFIDSNSIHPQRLILGRRRLWAALLWFSRSILTSAALSKVQFTPFMIQASVVLLFNVVSILHFSDVFTAHLDHTVLTRMRGRSRLMWRCPARETVR